MKQTIIQGVLVISCIAVTYLGYTKYVDNSFDIRNLLDRSFDQTSNEYNSTDEANTNSEPVFNPPTQQAQIAAAEAIEKDDSVIANFPTSSLDEYLNSGNSYYDPRYRSFQYSGAADSGMSISQIDWSNGDLEVHFKSDHRMAVYWLKDERCGEQGFWGCKYEYEVDYRIRLIDNDDGDEYFVYDIPAAEKTRLEKTLGFNESGNLDVVDQEVKVTSAYANGRFRAIFKNIPYEVFDNFSIRGGGDDSFHIRHLGRELSIQHIDHIKHIKGNIDLSTMSPRALVSATNKYRAYKDIERYIAEELNRKLTEFESLSIYQYVLSNLHDDVERIDTYANEYSRLILDQVVIPRNDIQTTRDFLQNFNYSSGDILSDAYTHLLELEESAVVVELNTLINDGIPESDAKERIARKLYIEAIRAKDDGEIHKFASKYHIATRNDLFSTTQASFDLHRDKEMRSFLEKKFDRLIDVTRQASSQITSQVRDVILAVENVSQQVANQSEVIASQAYEESWSDEYARNERFMHQQLVFDRAYRGEK